MSHIEEILDRAKEIQFVLEQIIFTSYKCHFRAQCNLLYKHDTGTDWEINHNSLDQVFTTFQWDSATIFSKKIDSATFDFRQPRGRGAAITFNAAASGTNFPEIFCFQCIVQKFRVQL